MAHVIFVDSNIWCYYLDTDTDEHAAAARALKKALKHNSIHINTIVLLEVAHYLIKHLGAEKGKQNAQKLLNSPVAIHPVELATARKAIDTLSEHTHTGIGGRDASIIASMRQHGIRTLMTHDKAFRKIPSITVVDPVEA